MRFRDPYTITWGGELDIHHYSSVSGGCINEAFRVEAGQQIFFVKRHQKALAPMFQAEFEALKELEATHTIQVPTPISSGAFIRLLVSQAFGN